MSLFNDPVFLRGLERLLLVVAAAYLGFLGYKLFLYGMACGRTAPNPKSQIVTALYSGAGPGLFFIVVAGAVVLVTSFTSNPQKPAAGGRPATAPTSRSADRSDLIRQLALMKQSEKAHQNVIRDLRNQLSSARTNSVMTQAVVDQMQASLDAATPDIDLNSLYTQMTEMNDELTALQEENDNLRAENAALRAQSGLQ